MFCWLTILSSGTRVSARVASADALTRFMLAAVAPALHKSFARALVEQIA